MRTPVSAAVVAALLLAAAPLHVTAGTRKPGLGKLIAGKLLAQKAVPRPAIHTTDFAGDRIGCITLSRDEMRRFGYPGHAFVCEEAQTGEVLGAALTRNGFRICEIAGRYAGDGCYDLDICGVADGLCAY